MAAPGEQGYVEGLRRRGVDLTPETVRIPARRPATAAKRPRWRLPPGPFAGADEASAHEPHGARLAQARGVEADDVGARSQPQPGVVPAVPRQPVVAAAVGCARGAMEYALDYAKTREQFGKPIIEHQAVAFRLADMKARVEAARLLVWRSAKRLDAGLDATESSAIAKLTASETAMWVTWAAVQTLGGWGYSREFLVEKWMRDAKLEEIEEGTSDIQRLIISRSMARS